MNTYALRGLYDPSLYYTHMNHIQPVGLHIQEILTFASCRPVHIHAPVFQKMKLKLISRHVRMMFM